MVNLHHNAVCDRCGFRYKASELKLMWNGLRVCPEDFELRNAQEFVRAMSNDKAPYGSKALGEYIFLSPNEVTADDL
jgi:hypothetical protein